MKTVVMAVVAAVAMLGTTPAIATPTSKELADAAYADGQKRYAAGDFVGAAQRFNHAYDLDQDPVYLFNAAQALRFGKSCGGSADLYRKFLTAAPGAPNRAKVERYIAEMDACAKPTGGTVEPAPLPLASDPGLPVAEPRSDELMPAMPPTPVDHASRGNTLKWIGVGVGALGVVGLGIGVFESVTTLQARDDREALCAGGCTWSDVEVQARALDERGTDAETSSIVAYTVGGIAVLGGVALYLISAKSDQEAPAVAITPMRGGAMVSSGFSF